MNAVEILDRVRQNGATLAVVAGQLVVRRPSGTPLPDDLLFAVREHKPELMVALGEPIDVAVSAVLAELRPQLSPALRGLSDCKLLALINWSIMCAWEAAIRNAGRGVRQRVADA